MAARTELIGRLLHHPFWMIAVGLALTLALGAGLPRLHVDSGIDIFFAPDDPHLLAEQHLKATSERPSPNASNAARSRF